MWAVSKDGKISKAFLFSSLELGPSLPPFPDCRALFLFHWPLLDFSNQCTCLRASCHYLSDTKRRYKQQLLWDSFTLFICLCYRFFALSFPRYLLFGLLPLTRQRLPSSRLHFCFSPLCHRSLLQRVAPSRLSDTEMMQKDKTIWGKAILFRLSLFRHLAASDSWPLVVFFRVCVFSLGGGGVYRESCQTVDSHCSSISGPELALLTRCRHRGG